ncbi:MAG: 23S rRNA (adenine(2503)-C(2))-methyltransferase RlmN [Phycisphaeraceae bacterium]
MQEDPPPHIFEQTPDTLAARFEQWGLPAYRARQVLEWVYHHGIADPQRMTNLPKRERAALTERMTFLRGATVGHQRATDGTQKLLMEWAAPHGHEQRLKVLGDGALQTECVMIPSESSEGRARKTACISSQVGCPVGCRFCASGLGGLDANLTSGQIVEQAWQLAQLEGVGRITNIVFMGMGEPLANFGAVTGAVRTLMASWGMAISGRRITISTVGLPTPMRRLADLQLPVTLAVSLHAPNDEVRRQLIPWAERVSVQQLIDAGRYYFEHTGREVTLEYILLRHVNDRPEHARELVEVARELRSNINLIRYNEVKGMPFDRPTQADVQRFQQILRRGGVNVHIRASRGRDIAAACGQLRHEAQQARERVE